MDEFFTSNDLPALLYNEFQPSEAAAFKRHIALSPQLTEEYNMCKVAYNTLNKTAFEPLERSFNAILEYSRRAQQLVSC